MRGAKRRAPKPAQDGVITALVRRRGDAERITVRLGSSPSFDLAAQLVEREGLHVGDGLPAEVQERLVCEDQPFRARETAVRLLAYRDRSAKEVEARLRSADFDPGLVAPVTSWLRDLGYLDDRRFASRYVAEKAKAGWGSQRIRAELGRKGVERTVIDEALAEQQGREAVTAGAGAVGEEAALALARRRFAAQFITDPHGAGRRLTGFLARRGYDWETIARIERLLRSEAETQRADEAGGQSVS